MIFDLQRFAGKDTAYLKDNLQGFVPVEQAKEIIKEVVRGSSVLKLSKVEPMQAEVKKFPIMTDGPGAYWVGETERIKTSVAQWIFVQITAKKLAVIIPVTREKLNDTTINVFEELKPYIGEAFYKAFDAACLFGTNSPFTKNIFDTATSAGNVVTVGTNKQLDQDISDVIARIEDAGLDPNGFAGHYGVKNTLRKLRDANGNQLYVPGVTQDSLYNLPLTYSRNNCWDKDKASLIAANWNYSIVGVRQGIEFEILREATLQTVTMSDGKPLSLAENDMVAIKATMRIGFLPIKDKAFAVLAPKQATPAP